MVQVGYGAVLLRRPATLRLLDAGFVGSNMQPGDKVRLVGELGHHVDKRDHVAFVPQEAPAGSPNCLPDVPRQRGLAASSARFAASTVAS